VKGQLSLEALLLLALSLSLLGIAVFTVNNLQQKQIRTMQQATVKTSLGDIASAADEICVLGQGNSRALPISQYPFRLSAQGKTLSASLGNWSSTRTLICTPDADGLEFYGTAYLWFEETAGGSVPKIRVSINPPG